VTLQLSRVGLVGENGLSFTGPIPDDTINVLGLYAESGAWDYAEGYWAAAVTPLASGGEDHYSTTYLPTLVTPDKPATFRWIGTRAQWRTAFDPSHGIPDVYLDGVLVDSVDCYAATRMNNQVGYDTGTLTDGEHVLEVFQTDNRNPLSTNVTVTIDCAVYLGVLVDPDTPPNEVNGQLGVVTPSFSLAEAVAFRDGVGVQLGMVGAFNEIGSPPPARVGSYPMLHSPKFNLTTPDSVIYNWGVAAVASGQENAWVRLMWEFNGSFMVNFYTLDAALWIQKFRNMANILRSVPGQQFKIVWSPIHFSHTDVATDGTPARQFVEDRYPGNAWVDRIYPDLYGQDWSGDKVRHWTEFMQWVVDFSAAHGKLWGLGEWGVRVRPDGGGTGDDTTFVSIVVDFASDPNCEFLIYFEYPLAVAGDGDGDLLGGGFENARAAVAAAW
jgi:hypothetical protein